MRDFLLTFIACGGIILTISSNGVVGTFFEPMQTYTREEETAYG